MHILIIPSWYVSSYNPLLGSFFKEQSEALAKQNIKVGVLAVQGVGIRQVFEHKKIDFSNKEILENEVVTFRKQFLDTKIPFISNLTKSYYFKRNFKKYISKYGKPDLVHIHSFFVGEIAIWIKNNFNINYIITEHNSSFMKRTLNNQQLFLSQKIFSNSTYNLVVSNKLGKLLSKKFNLDFAYLPNGVNVEDFNIKKYIESTTYKFINIAFLDNNKNQDMLIKAFYKLSKELSNITLTIVGNGKEYNNLQSLINNLKLENKVTLFGSASRSEVKNLLHESDCFVLSSKYETFGVVLIEAMACGLPVISTKCGGPESIITNPSLGLLCSIDTESIKNSMKQIYLNKDNFDSNYIRDYTIKKFSENAVCKNLIKIYKEVINKS